MTITTGFTLSFKSELLAGIHNFSARGDTFKVALINDPARTVRDYGSRTTNYSNLAEDEINGSAFYGPGYTVGGVTLTNLGISRDEPEAFTSFAPAVWSDSSFTTTGALLYNARKANRSVLLIGFTNVEIIGSGSYLAPVPGLSPPPPPPPTGHFQLIFPGLNFRTALIQVD